MGFFGGLTGKGGGGNQTVTNVQALPPEVAAPLTAAYADFNPFQQAFNQVGAFDPQAALAGTAGLSAGEKSAITQAQSLLNTQPAFLTSAFATADSTNLRMMGADFLLVKDKTSIASSTSLPRTRFATSRAF